MTKYLTIIMLKLRWIYFHINPNYIKFKVSSSDQEAYFFHSKTNTIHYNYKWID